MGLGNQTLFIMDNATNKGELPTALATSVGAAVMFLFFIEGLIGNLWILSAILSRKKVWNVINVFIVSLCFNDVLALCLIVVFIIDSYIWQKWTAGPTMCKLNPEFTVAFTGCSLWHSLLIALHRYIVVAHNDVYKRMSKKAYVVSVLLLTRLIPLACTIPGFLSSNTTGYVPKLLRCIFLPSQTGRIVSVTFIQIIIPCIVVICCYLLIFAFVMRTGRQMQNSNFILQREIQITKMFGVIFFMIMFGFVPYSVIRNMDKNNQFSGDLYVLVSVFYAIGTCSNPLIYGAMSTDIRQTCWEFLQDLGRCMHCESVSACLREPITEQTLMTTYAATEHSPKTLIAMTDRHNGSVKHRIVDDVEVKTGGGNDHANDNDSESSDNNPSDSLLKGHLVADV